MISTLKKLERFLDSEDTQDTQMQANEDQRVQLLIQWFETYDEGPQSTLPMQQKRTRLISFARNILTEPRYQIAITTSTTVESFPDVAMELVRIIAAPLPLKKMNYMQMLQQMQKGALSEPCAYEDYYECTVQREGDPYRQWICFTGSSNNRDKAVVIAAYWGRGDSATAIFSTIMLTGPTKHIDSQFFRMVSKDSNKPNALLLPAICLVFQQIARMFSMINEEVRQVEEANGRNVHCLVQTTCAYWIGVYCCGAKFYADVSRPFCFVAEPTETRKKRIRVEIGWEAVIVEQIG